MPDGSDRSHSRRRLLGALAGASAAIAAGALPRSWARPIVESVLLPAHAQASPVFFVSCASAPVSGSNVTTGVAINTTITITPNPGAGETVFAQLFCGGVGTSPVALPTLTDASGQTTFGFVSSVCGPGTELRLRFSYMGATSDCFWNVV